MVKLIFDIQNAQKGNEAVKVQKAVDIAMNN